MISLPAVFMACRKFWPHMGQQKSVPMLHMGSFLTDRGNVLNMIMEDVHKMGWPTSGSQTRVPSL